MSSAPANPRRRTTLPKYSIEIVPDDPTAGVVQVKPAGLLIDWNFRDAGRTSVIVAEVVASGPWFVTTIV